MSYGCVTCPAELPVLSKKLFGATVGHQ